MLQRTKTSVTYFARKSSNPNLSIYLSVRCIRVKEISLKRAWMKCYSVLGKNSLLSQLMMCFYSLWFMFLLPHVYLWRVLMLRRAIVCTVQNNYPPLTRLGLSDLFYNIHNSLCSRYIIGWDCACVSLIYSFYVFILSSFIMSQEDDLSIIIFINQTINMIITFFLKIVCSG